MLKDENCTSPESTAAGISDGSAKAFSSASMPWRAKNPRACAYAACMVGSTFRKPIVTFVWARLGVGRARRDGADRDEGGEHESVAAQRPAQRRADAPPRRFRD